MGQPDESPREDMYRKELQKEGPGVNLQNELEEAACDGLPTPCLAKLSLELGRLAERCVKTEYPGSMAGSQQILLCSPAFPNDSVQRFMLQCDDFVLQLAFANPLNAAAPSLGG